MNEIEKFGSLLNNRARQVADANKGTGPELGIINGDGSLSVSSLSNPIPKGEYMVSLHLKTANTGGELTKTATDGTHSHGPSGSHSQYQGDGTHSHTNEGPHSHVVLVSGTIRGVQPGDRVLVLWVGTEPVVVDIVVNS